MPNSWSVFFRSNTFQDQDARSSDDDIISFEESENDFDLEPENHENIPNQSQDHETARSSDDDIVSFDGNENMGHHNNSNVQNASQENEIVESNHEDESTDDGNDPEYLPTDPGVAKTSNRKKKPLPKKKQKRSGNFGRKSKGAKKKQNQR